MANPSSNTDAAPPERGSQGLIFLAGAIKFWWLNQCDWCSHVEEMPEPIAVCPKCGKPGMKEWWGGPEHTAYVNWRNEVRHILIEEGFLTYAPHEAFKGTWTDAAQAVNDAGISAASVMLVLSEDWVPSVGTDDEVDYADLVGTPVVYAPPGTDKETLINMIRKAMSHCPKCRYPHPENEPCVVD